jgi:hypothetical protein
MSANLVLGPLLRYAGARDATVWVETDARAVPKEEADEERAGVLRDPGLYAILSRPSKMREGGEECFGW